VQADQIDACPAVWRGRMVYRIRGDSVKQLSERHNPSDFEHRTRDKLDSPA
jgi:hypothetical protein